VQILVNRLPRTRNVLCAVFGHWINRWHMPAIILRLIGTNRIRNM
jgi:hypothetical protein